MTKSVQKFSVGRRNVVLGTLLTDTTPEQFLSYVSQRGVRIRQTGDVYSGTVLYMGKRYAISFFPEAAVGFQANESDTEEVIGYLMEDFLKVTNSNEVDNPTALDQLEQIHRDIWMDMNARQG